MSLNFKKMMWDENITSGIIKTETVHEVMRVGESPPWKLCKNKKQRSRLES